MSDPTLKCRTRVWLIGEVERLRTLLATAIMRYDRGIPLCPATDGPYVCTLKLGHVDDHEAWNDEIALHTWAQEVKDG